MSVHTTRTLTCDGCGRWQTIEDTETVAEARRCAKRYGWTQAAPPPGDRRRIDHCRTCSKPPTTAGQPAGQEQQ